MVGISVQAAMEFHVDFQRGEDNGRESASNELGRAVIFSAFGSMSSK
jgi:hypothetical protein